jgi:cobalt-precorrin-5B (C1)-methyltransferase
MSRSYLSPMSGSGYTLPVFAVAAAKAALMHLLSLDQEISDRSVLINLLDEGSPVRISVEQFARLGDDSRSGRLCQRALAVTVSDPGDNLDLTRNMPLWAEVSLGASHGESLILKGGEGLGRSASGEPAIYQYARRLFAANLEPWIPELQCATVTIILPEGRSLAARTSNAAFGIVEGLSLLGTSGISKPLSSESHFEAFQQSLRSKAADFDHLVFCIGSNGMQVADRLGIDASRVVQTGNWIGALLVEAGIQQVQQVHLLGYQGKLIKLAGGIFNTSSHLADAKLEILSSAVVQCGGDSSIASTILNCKTADEAYRFLLSVGFVEPVFDYLVTLINQKSQRYVEKYANVTMEIKTTLFDRLGNLITPFEFRS